MERNKISTKNLIALCHMIDIFDDFDKNLLILLEQEEDKTDLIYKLGKITNKKRCFASPKIKKFYDKNKRAIDIINTYSSIVSFINQNYQWTWDKQDIEFVNYDLYQHLLENRNNLAQILSVLKKIKELGFNYLEFNQELDFTQETYTYDHYDLHANIPYLENIEVIPTYYQSEIKYKSNGSNYKIILSIFSRILDKRNKSIILNNLNFDPKCLPADITLEETLGKIDAKQKEKETSILKDLIDLNVGIEDLFLQFSKIEKAINNLSDFEDKEELIKLLQAIKEKAFQMQEISDCYNTNVINNNDNITKSIFEEEKKIHKTRRINPKKYL